MDFQNAKRNQNSIRFHVMVQRLDRLKTAKFSAARKLAKFDLGLRIYRDSQCFIVFVASFVRSLDVCKDRVRFGNFF